MIVLIFNCRFQWPIADRTKYSGWSQCESSSFFLFQDFVQDIGYFWWPSSMCMCSVLGRSGCIISSRCIRLLWQTWHIATTWKQRGTCAAHEYWMRTRDEWKFIEFAAGIKHICIYFIVNLLPFIFQTVRDILACAYGIFSTYTYASRPHAAYKINCKYMLRLASVRSRRRAFSGEVNRTGDRRHCLSAVNCALVRFS